MNKDEIKARLKTLTTEIKAQKAIIRDHNTSVYKRENAQSYSHKASLEARALHIALAYLRYMPFYRVEVHKYHNNPINVALPIYHERLRRQILAINMAKEALGMVENLYVGGNIRTKATAHKEFDNWVQGLPYQLPNQEAA